MEPMIRAILIGAAAVAMIAFALFLTIDQSEGSKEFPSIAEELANEPTEVTDEGALRKRAIMTTAAARKGRKVQARTELIKSPAARPAKNEDE